MNALRQVWSRFWFEPSGPANLGFLRLLFYGGMLLTYGVLLRADYAAWSGVSDAFWFPIHVARVVPLGVFPSEVLRALTVVWFASMAFAAVGLWTRPASWIALLSGAYLLALPHNFGKIHHADAVLAITLGTLAFSRCGQCWSVDALLRRWRNPGAAEPAPSGEFTWPVRVTWTLTCLLFLGAGVSKLRHSGLAWIFSENMTVRLIQHGQPLGEFVAQWAWVGVAMALTTVVFEVAAPLALFSRVARAILIPGFFVLQLGIGVFMGVWFFHFLLIYLFWVPWDRVGRWLARRLGARPGSVMVYDGDCGLCTRTVAVVRALNLLGRVELRDLNTEWDVVARRYPGLDRDACLAEMHVLSDDGRTFAGFAAYRHLAKSLPLGWAVLPFLYLPLASWIGDRAYQRLSARGRGHGCALPGVAA